MDDAARELLVGLIANALSDLLSKTPHKETGDIPAGSSAAQNALTSLSSVEEIKPALGGEYFHSFLQSAEAHQVLRQIYASDPDAGPGRDVEQAFRGLWEARLPAQAKPLPDSEVSRVFHALVLLAEAALEQAISDGDLSAIDARNARRHIELRDSLKSVHQMVELLERPALSSPADIDDFANRYRRQIAAREGVIRPPTLDGAREFPIDDLYVPARLNPSTDRDADPLDYQSFAKFLYRSVVLGKPGSGKSTLAKKLTADTARNVEGTASSQSELVPFLVVLRDYGARKKSSPCSIVDFIAETSNSRYQVEAPIGAVEYLLLTNRALVIFDGLDELLDTSYRAEISGDVESFATLYPSVAILVTSREVGYHQAPLRPNKFPAFHLDEFEESDVHEYATKWFSVSKDGGLTPAEQTTHFMSDSEEVADLRANPLMLGLMCNLYKGSGYIPRNRPDVYEACAELLFDRWDRLRHIHKPTKIESALRPTMRHLAWWIYSDPELQSGVTERRLIQQAAGYLLGRRFDAQDEAGLEAKRFIEFCRGRAWIFTDIGTTSAGDRLYQFTHRTFLEFFAAEHLVRQESTPAKLLRVLKPHISVREWDVVSQLAFQLLDHNVDGAGGELLLALTEGSIQPGDSGGENRLEFAVRSLSFMVPPPAVTRIITDKALALFGDWCRLAASEGAQARVLPDKASLSVRSLSALLATNPENESPILQGLFDGMSQQLRDTTVAKFAAEFGLNSRLPTEDGKHAYSMASALGSSLVEKEGRTLRRVGTRDWMVATDLVLREAMAMEEFFEHHGLSALTSQRPYPLFSGTERVPLSEIMVGHLLWEHPNALPTGEIANGLAIAARVIRAEGPPFASFGLRYFGWFFRGPQVGRMATEIEVDDLDTDAFFGFACLMAAHSEHMLVAELPSKRSTLHEMSVEGGPLWRAVAPLLLARGSTSPNDSRSRILESLPIGEKDAQLMSDWVDGQVSFVRSEESGHSLARLQ